MDGKQNSTKSDISIVKEDEVLINNVTFKDRNGKTNYPKVQHRMLLHPRGRCLLIKPSKEETMSFKHLYLYTIATQKFNASDVPFTLNVFLMDPVDSPLIYPLDVQMKGDHIKVPLETFRTKGKFWDFTIKISRSYHVESDPRFQCKEYNQENAYGQCVREELKSIFEQKLNCNF